MAAVETAAMQTSFTLRRLGPAPFLLRFVAWALRG
jgi:hypothetical protein